MVRFSPKLHLTREKKVASQVNICRSIQDEKKESRNLFNSSLGNAQDKVVSNMHQELLACSQKHFSGHRVES